MSFADEVKQKVDIVQVIGQYTKLTKAGRLMRGLCPFHSEKTPSFYVYPEQQTWHCFGACSTGGDVFSFIMKKETLGFREALETLAERTGVPVPASPLQTARKEEKNPLYEANAAAAKYYYDYLLTAPAAEKVRSYLENRGINRKSIEDFQIGLSPEGRDNLKPQLAGQGIDEKSLLAAGLLFQAEDGRTFDRFHGRLMFTIRDIKGQVIGFGARALDNSMPKYMNSPQTAVFDKSGVLFAIDRAAPAIRKADRAIIVEGYVDAIMAHQYGVANVVASMGTSITDRQVNILKKMTGNLVLALDPDAAGEEAMLRCVSYEAITGSEIKVMSLPEGKDPDEVIKDDAALWAKLVEEAGPVMERVFKNLLAGLDMKKPGDKQAAVDRLLPVIIDTDDLSRRADYIKKLADIVKVKASDLESEVIMRRANKTKVKRGEPKAAEMPIKHALEGDPLEEHFLALLIQHPELKTRCGDVSLDYFSSTENREVLRQFLAGDSDQTAGDMEQVINQHVERLKARPVTADRVQERFTSCSLRLRERFLKNMEARRSEILAVEAETGGVGADLARLQADGIQNSIKLREVHRTLGKR